MAAGQVAHIDITKESPCGHGTVICFSVYAGPRASFGECSPNGEPVDGLVQSQLWVDTMADERKDQVRLWCLVTFLLHGHWCQSFESKQDWQYLLAVQHAQLLCQ